MENSGEKNWKLKLAVCDDEKLFCDEIFKRLKQLRPEYDIDVFTSGVELLACEKEYDIIFLDIQMPEKDGIEVGISLRERKVESKIIYMTFYREFAPEVLRAKAHRFLVKDCTDQKLIEALETAEKEIFSDVKLCIEEDGNIVYTSIRNISCVEAYGDGVYVYLEDRVIDSKKTLSHWAEKLGQEYFYQVNRSFLVGYEHIFRYSKERLEVSFRNGPIKVSRRKWKEFQEKYDNYIYRRHIKI